MLHWGQIRDCFTGLRFACWDGELICDQAESSDSLMLAGRVRGEVIGCKLEI